METLCRKMKFHGWLALMSDSCTHHSAFFSTMLFISRVATSSLLVTLPWSRLSVAMRSLATTMQFFSFLGFPCLSSCSMVPSPCARKVWICRVEKWFRSFTVLHNRLIWARLQTFPIRISRRRKVHSNSSVWSSPSTGFRQIMRPLAHAPSPCNFRTKK